MDGIKVKIGDREIPLRFRMNQFQEIEEELGNLGEFDELLFRGKQRIRNVIFVLRVLGNAGLAYEGKEPDITEEWLRENMVPQDLTAYQVAVFACLRRESESEAAKEENENKERDLVLEEIQKKKEAKNSPIEE